MQLYKTPNVYTEEVPTLPPSVVPVATAVPAFIGCTEKAGDKNEYLNQPVRISSILEYNTIFGGAHPTTFTVNLDDKNQILRIDTENASSGTPKYLMYYTLRLFFENGGGLCYIVSIGDYNNVPSKDNYTNGLTAISQEDEPTLLLLTDAVTNNYYYELCKDVLKQCNNLKDRFGIFDVLESAIFRNGIGTDDLKYGAAYYPYLQTSLNYIYNDETVNIQPVGNLSTGYNGLKVIYFGEANTQPKFEIKLLDSSTAPKFDSNVPIKFVINDKTLSIYLPKTEGSEESQVSRILDAFSKLSKTTPKENNPLSIVNSSLQIEQFVLQAAGDPKSTISADFQSKDFVFDNQMTTLEAIKSNKTELYHSIQSSLNAMRVVMPPSGAIAGIYAKVDRERGVWKAPANVSLSSVLGPTVKVTNEEQDNLNVDATSGKSINVIRSFTGKGTLVWGARTLAGNDNEWRYVSVRRLFNLIEESIQKATSFVVFESNNAITWLKVKTIIESYLDGLWRQGALAGATQRQAYFVNVGLGQTMIPQDILEGRMIIEIGVAAVRPAEFIVLRFSHKLQEA